MVSSSAHRAGQAQVVTAFFPSMSLSALYSPSSLILCALGSVLGLSRGVGAQHSIGNSRKPNVLSRQDYWPCSLEALAWHYLPGLALPWDRLSAQLTRSSNPQILATSLQNRV